MTILLLIKANTIRYDKQMLRLGNHRFTIVPRKESVRQSSKGPWWEERRCEHAGANYGRMTIRNEI